MGTGSTSTQVRLGSLPWLPTLTPVIMLGLLILAEVLAATTWLDGASLEQRSGLPGMIGIAGAWVLRLGVGFIAAFAAFAGLEGRLTLHRLLPSTAPFQVASLGVHLLAAGAFVLTSAALYGNWPTDFPNLLAASWVLSAAAVVFTLLLLYAPIAFWTGILRDSGAALWLAAAVSFLGVVAVRLSQSMWQFAAELTFSFVQFLLRPVLPNLTADPSRLLIRGNKFGVIVNQECSGLEGIGLMLVFSLAWLWIYRREFRFPRAYLLVPIGIVTLYSLNAVRIAALLLIGDAGARDIAVGGFHSQAGWIAFNAVALGMTLIVPRMPWFVLNPRRSKARERSGENPTAAYLLPFLAILATGMLTRAVSADFDWLYGFRFATAAGVVWAFRHRLAQLDWRFGWLGIGAGVLTVAVWLAFDRWQGIPSAAMPGPLAAAGASSQALWIALRALAACTTVPIAEELAFRGFLMRRFCSADFEGISFERASWLAILLSSVAFGLLHGDRWPAGIAAGLIFALAVRRTGRIGDAVIAHSLANAALSALVVAQGQWQYW